MRRPCVTTRTRSGSAKRLTESLSGVSFAGLKTRPPYTVVAYAAFAVLIVVVSLVREGPHQRFVYGALVLLVASFGLVLGVWLSWLFLTAVAAVGVIGGLFRPEWPWTSIIVVNGVMLALLLARPSRRYARRGRPRVPVWFHGGRAA
jgi:hypothetical protein